MASRFWVLDTGTWDASDTTHWSASSGGLGGASVPVSGDTVTFDANSCLVGGTVTPNYNMTVTSITMGAFTGTLDFSANNNSPTMASFSLTGAGVRTLSMGSGTWTLTGNNTTIWSSGTTTNLTLNRGTSTVDCTYSGSTGTRTITTGTTQALGLNNLKISAGTDIILLTTSIRCNDLDFTGFTGSLSSSGNAQLFGSLTLGAGMTIVTTSTTWSFAATTGPNLITTNNVQFNRPITFDGVGGSWQLADDLDMDGANVRTLTLTNGTLNANNHNIKVGLFSSSNTNTRVITMGSGTWELVGTGTVWNTNTNTGLTLTPNSSTIKITNSTNTDNTFAGGGKTFNNIWWARGASTAIHILTGANTFADFKDDGSAAHTITFPNVTTTVSTFTVSGTLGNLITLIRTGASGTFTLSKTSGIVSSDYLSISNSVATGGASWFAGANSTDGGGNTGWNFIAPPVSAGEFFQLF